MTSTVTIVVVMILIIFIRIPILLPTLILIVLGIKIGIGMYCLIRTIWRYGNCYCPERPYGRCEDTLFDKGQYWYKTSAIRELYGNVYNISNN